MLTIILQITELSFKIQSCFCELDINLPLISFDYNTNFTMKVILGYIKPHVLKILFSKSYFYSKCIAFKLMSLFIKFILKILLN